MHRKVLTEENLTKRGIIGPHRCSICCSASKTSDHLFMDCKFAQEVWTLSLHDLNVYSLEKIPLVTLFSTWRMRYPHSIWGKFVWSRIWVEIPKYVCWNIWLPKNYQIFNNTQHLPLKVAAKVKALLFETVAIQTFKKDNSLHPEEKKWMGTYTFKDRKMYLNDPT